MAPLTAQSARGAASSVERLGAAHEQIALNIEAQHAIRLLRNANSNALADFPRVDLSGVAIIARQPKRTLLAKVEPVERTIDPQRLGEPSWAAREITQALGSAIVAHDRDPFERFERPDQDARADAFRLARDIQHPGKAVGEVDIGVAALEKERAIARRHAPIGVSRGVPDDIGLGFNN